MPMLKKILLLMIIVFSTFFSLTKAKALVGNGYIWNKSELEVGIHESVDTHLSEFKVDFYYNGVITDEEVIVELDRFYYGNVSISTAEVGVKKIKLYAHVFGYSTSDRREITLRIVDREAPRIDLKKDLVINIGDAFNVDEYFNITDNHKVENIITNTQSVNFTVPGSYPIELEVKDFSGNTISRTYNIIVVDKTLPIITAVPIIEIEYGNDKFNISDYFKAIDNYDGDITSGITIEGLDVFKLGEQTCIITVRDSSDNEKQIEKKVRIIDTTPPSLELKKYTDTVMLGEKIDFKNYIESVSDNLDDLTIDDVQIDKKSLRSEIGSYEIIFELKDSYGNTIKRKLSLDITYNEEPKILCDDITIGVGEKINLYDYVSVTDKYDENIKDSLEIFDSALNINKAGKYEIIVEATNKANIKSKKTFFVEVKDSKSSFLNSDIYIFLYDNKIVILIGVGIITFISIKIYKKRKTEV